MVQINMRCCCCYMERNAHHLRRSFWISLKNRDLPQRYGEIWLLFHNQFITCLLKIVKHGRKANLNAKSCSDNSELAKNKKLLRMQKVAPNENNWGQVGVVCTHHYSSYKCTKCNCTKLNQLQQLYQQHQTEPNYSNYTTLQQLH